MSNGWGLNVMDMFYNTTPHIKARPAYKTRNRISAMTPPASFTAHLTMLASRTRGAITNYALCQIPLARTCQRAYKVNVKMSQGRTAFRCHVLQNIAIREEQSREFLNVSRSFFFLLLLF